MVVGVKAAAAVQLNRRQNYHALTQPGICHGLNIGDRDRSLSNQCVQWVGGGDHGGIHPNRRIRMGLGDAAAQLPIPEVPCISHLSAGGDAGSQMRGIAQNCRTAVDGAEATHGGVVDVDQDRIRRCRDQAKRIGDDQTKGQRHPRCECDEGWREGGVAAQHDGRAANLRPAIDQRHVIVRIRAAAAVQLHQCTHDDTLIAPRIRNGCSVGHDHRRSCAHHTGRVCHRNDHQISAGAGVGMDRSRAAARQPIGKPPRIGDVGAGEDGGYKFSRITQPGWPIVRGAEAANRHIQHHHRGRGDHGAKAVGGSDSRGVTAKAGVGVRWRRAGPGATIAKVPGVRHLRAVGHTGREICGAVQMGGAAVGGGEAVDRAIRNRHRRGGSDAVGTGGCSDCGREGADAAIDMGWSDADANIAITKIPGVSHVCAAGNAGRELGRSGVKAWAIIDGGPPHMRPHRSRWFRHSQYQTHHSSASHSHQYRP